MKTSIIILAAAISFVSEALATDDKVSGWREVFFEKNTFRKEAIHVYQLLSDNLKGELTCDSKGRLYVRPLDYAYSSDDEHCGKAGWSAFRRKKQFATNVRLEADGEIHNIGKISAKPSLGIKIDSSPESILEAETVAVSFTDACEVNYDYKFTLKVSPTSAWQKQTSYDKFTEKTSHSYAIKSGRYGAGRLSYNNGELQVTTGGQHLFSLGDVDVQLKVDGEIHDVRYAWAGEHSFGFRWPATILAAKPQTLMARIVDFCSYTYTFDFEIE